jgi:hypothetical protein
MSQAVSPQHPVALRSQYRHLRALLAVAIIAIVGLIAAVVVLATSDGGGSAVATPAVQVTSAAQTADTGARLDHRGLEDRANSLSATADTGARLDHRGLKAATSGPAH